MTQTSEELLISRAIDRHADAEDWHQLDRLARKVNRLERALNQDGAGDSPDSDERNQPN